MKTLLIVIMATFAVGCSSSGGSGGDGSSPEQKAREFRACKALKIQDVAQPLQYCSLKLAATKYPTKIIYFLHGAGGSARDIYNSLIESVVQNMPEVAVVGISYGAEETIPVEVGQPPASMTELIDSAMPAIEFELGISPSTDLERDLVGMSLGGFNALNLAAGNTNWFRKVAALCPALIGFNPFSDSEVQAYIQSNPKIQAAPVIDLIGKLRQKFGTPENWRIRDPIFLASNGYYNGLPIFLSTGSDDEFGFFQGAQQFKSAAQIGAMVDWHPVSGGHCSFDQQGLAAFLGVKLSVTGKYNKPKTAWAPQWSHE